VAGPTGNRPQSFAPRAAPSAAPPSSAADVSNAVSDVEQLRLRVAVLSVVGPVRETNEDHLGWFDEAGLDLAGTPGEEVRSVSLGGPAVGLMMADGLGGHGRGDLASRTATRIVLQALAAAPRPGLGEVRAALELANGALLAGELDGASDHRPGPQTTATVLVFTDDSVQIANVGDTRLYRMRDDVVELLTKDHSQAAELLRLKVITPHQARNHPGRHLLTRSVGADLTLRVESVARAVYPGDTYAVCTDGCWSGLEQEDLEAAFSEDPAAGARRLVDRAIELGGDDNASVAIIHVDAVGASRDADASDRPFWRRLFGSRP
jgi:protein phosphatase